MTLEQTEAECAANATAPRVSLHDIENKIAARYCITADQALKHQYPLVELTKPNDALKLLTLCILVMRNGFTVIGKSAPASAENFNAQLGAKLAYEDAIRQLWPLEGYALREKLSGEGL